MSLIVEGRLYSGEDTSSSKATLSVVEGKARFVTQNGRELVYDLKSLDLHERLGSIPRVLETNDGLRFETSDFAKADELEKLLSRSSRIHLLENKWSLAVLTAVALVLFVVYLFFEAIPKLAFVLAPKVPASVAEQISKPIEKLLQYQSRDGQQLSEPETALFIEVTERYRSIFKTNQTVELLESPEPNAFILPNGHIFVTTNLVKISETPEQLLSVLFHEQGHYVHHHAMQSLLQNSALSLLIITISGGTEWTNVPILLLGNTYSQQHELQADAFAIQTVDAQKIERKQMKAIFEKLKKATSDKYGNLPSFLSTHPGFDERLKLIDKVKE